MIPIKIKEYHGIKRELQPTSINTSFMKGTVFSDTCFSLKHDNDVFCQLTPLVYWDDNSVKWATLDFFLSVEANESLTTELVVSSAAKSCAVDFYECDKSINIETGKLDLSIAKGNDVPLSIKLNGKNKTDFKEAFNIIVYDESSQPYSFNVLNVVVENEKSLKRNTVKIEGNINHPKAKLNLTIRLTLFPDNTFVKTDISVHNPSAAIHPGGLWDLGDPNTFKFRSLTLSFPSEPEEKANIFDHILKEQFSFDVNGRLDQFASGGDNWNSPVHKNANGLVTLDKNGYEIKHTDTISSGQRISPVLSIEDQGLAVFCQHFWQNFPKAFRLTERELNLDIFPDGTHELQPGERKTHTIWIDFYNSSQRFHWVENPLHIEIDSQYVKLTETIEHYSTIPKDCIITKVLAEGLHGKNNFFAKREQLDEYGWRNFGDIYADHETAGNKATEIFVSHYNNQYDPLFGFLYQYLTSGKRSYFELADDLAKHVSDIDIYHTTEDKDEYNGGLFWHTDHYLDASTCTHRTFSKNHTVAYEGYSSGGGPGGQHCYTMGLKLHYLLTGRSESKESVLQLTNWIRNSFEGSNSLLAKLFAIKQSGHIGVKNHLTGRYPMDRGTGHYVVALLDSYELTNERSYLTEAFAIIKHTIHPADDISQRNFDNIEATWFYVVFLQSIGKFLHVKEQESQFDDDFYYARDAFLHYAKWMLEFEKPYLEQIEKLEFPNATWAAQDLRKATVFAIAAYYASNKNECYQERANFFYNYVGNTLINEKSNYYTRIQVLLMQNIGGYHFYNQRIAKQSFDDIKIYPAIKKTNKWLKITKLLFTEICRLSIKTEIKWLSLRSEKFAKLIGYKY